MRDSLMPARNSAGNKTVLLLVAGGAAVLIVAVVLLVTRGEAPPAATGEPEPGDTGAPPMKVTQLVAPVPTKPIVERTDPKQASAEVEPEEKPHKKKRRRAKQKPQGKIDSNRYNEFINSRFGQVRACYERRLKINSLLSGKVDVNINVNDRGRVSWVTVNRDTVRDPEMLSCVKKTIRSWQFPEPEGGGVVVGKTFNFKKKGS